MKSKTFCILPWIHVASLNNGSVPLCCIAKPSSFNFNHHSIDEIWNSEYFKKARLSMLNGEKFEDCKLCWENEELGIRSHRENENSLWRKKFGYEYLEKLVNNTNKDGSINSDLHTIDLRMGNTCNLQCIMCRPHDSSNWLKHAVYLYDKSSTLLKWDWKSKLDEIGNHNFKWFKNKRFWKSILDKSSDLRHIIFGGGEPLLIKEHIDFLYNLVNDGNSKHISLRYHTNGTICDKKLIQLWQNFKSVELMISIDGYNEVNNYIRWPSEWEKIENNLLLYDAAPKNIILKILCTVQVANVFYLPEFLEWILGQKLKKGGFLHHSGTFDTSIYYFFSYLHWPRYLNIKAFPKAIKEKIEKKLISYADSNINNKKIQKLREIVSFMNSEDLSCFYDQTLEYYEKLDLLRKTNSEMFKL